MVHDSTINNDSINAFYEAWEHPNIYVYEVGKEDPVMEWSLQPYGVYAYSAWPVLGTVSAVLGDHIESISVYPNPVQTHLVMNEAFDAYEILNLGGSVIASAKGYGSEIDVSGLDPGQYLLRVIRGRDLGIAKFTKSK